MRVVSFRDRLRPELADLRAYRVPPADVPRTHDAFERLLRAKAERYAGRVSTYDPRRSGFGYLQLTQDLRVRRGDVWSLAEALGAVRARQHSSSRSLLVYRIHTSA